MYQSIKMFVSGGHANWTPEIRQPSICSELCILSWRKRRIVQTTEVAAARSAALLTIRAECFFAKLLSGTLLRQSLLHAPLRTWLQVIGVTLYFLDDVFRLNLALKATEGAFY
jgi:hypothetical protein